MEGSAKSIVEQFKQNDDFLSQEEVNALLKGVTGETDDDLFQDSFADYLVSIVNNLNSKRNEYNQLATQCSAQAEMVLEIIHKYKETHDGNNT